MTILGAILAGGQSSRFGSDKGAARLGDHTLIDHVIAGLRPQVDALAIVGREWPGLPSLSDRPAPDLGPLGGLCAALHYAAEQGYEQVLAVGCDTLPIPPDLAARLSPASCVVEGQWLIGLWPSALAAELEAWLAAGQDDRSIRAWMRHVGARMVGLDWSFANINRPEDLESLQRQWPTDWV